MAKTYYPSFRKLIHGLALFLAKYQATLVRSLNLAGSSYETDLATLVSIITSIDAHWPAYVEPQ